jgi:tRNA pseudouridine13 synthase
MRVKHFKDCFFARGERPLVLEPRDLKHASATDDLYPGRQKLSLEFTLPRGAYATMIIKRVTA